jgi:serine phosphatase RsbU (regulator of sigma subunit)
MRVRREEQLAGVRTIAEVAQRVLLRPLPRRVGPLELAVSYDSAVAEARIGGDLYEVVESPFGLRVLVGDVQGKGLAAVEAAAVVLGAFREAAYDEAELTALDARLERSASRALDGEKFVTAVLAEIRLEDKEIVLLNRGHPAPVLVRPEGAVFADPPVYCLPLGLGLHKGPQVQPHRVPFRPGDQLLLYTDGVTEARDGGGAFYPLGERAELLRGSDAGACVGALRADVIRHAAGPLHDDAAMLLVRYRPELAEGG